MKQIKVISKVVNGKLIRNRAKVKNAVQSFEGKEIEIIVKRKTNHRSNQQNAYYFGVVIPITIQAIENEWGESWDIEKTHNLFKSLFLYEEKVNPETSEIIKVPVSSTENTCLRIASQVNRQSGIHIVDTASRHCPVFRCFEVQ